MKKALQGPLRFTPFLRPMVWGGRRLAALLGQPLPTEEPHGEAWALSDHALHHSRVASGPLAGRTLREILDRERTTVLGPAAADQAVFPWLVKFLDANDWLSVQVHPDSKMVQRLLPGEGSKTEAWLVLDAVPGSRIDAGLLPGVGERELRAALAAGTVAECLHHFEPRPGDCVFLPAGTVHAVGGGVLMAEVQQTSDATFRLFDWNRRDAHGRSRQLHLDQALASIDWTRGPVHPIPVTGFSQPPASRLQELARCPFFVLEYRQETASFSWGGRGGMEVVVVLRGRGRLTVPWQEEPVLPGQAWLLPASMPAVACRPEPALDLLICSLP